MRNVQIVLAVMMLSACGGADPAAEAVAGEMVLPDITGDYVWQTNAETSSITFSAVQEGARFEGRFNEFRTAIRLNPDDLADAQIHAVIDMASVDAGTSDRNEALPTKDWFKIKSFPEARFVSTNVVQLDDGSFEAVGDLTIKGITRSITLPFSLELNETSAKANGAVELNRTEFNVGEGDYTDDQWVGYTVTVDIEIDAYR